ncbi:MAG: MarR family transcriptional regulator [Sphingomonadales bacterium]
MSRQLLQLDGIDERRAQWATELPGLDTRGMGTLGRMRLITTMVRPPIERIFAAHDLDSGEFDVLATLLRSGPPYRLRPTELYRSLMISSGGLTDRLGRLTKMGLVERAPSPGDGRSMLVVLTEAGRHLTEHAFRADMAMEANLISGLGNADQERLAELLRKLLLSIEQCETNSTTD